MFFDLMGGIPPRLSQALRALIFIFDGGFTPTLARSPSSHKLGRPVGLASGRCPSLLLVDGGILPRARALPLLR